VFDPRNKGVYYTFASSKHINDMVQLIKVTIIDIPASISKVELVGMYKIEQADVLLEVSCDKLFTKIICVFGFHKSDK